MTSQLYNRLIRPIGAMADQGLSSLTSFVVILLMARTLTPGGFGLFSLVLATVFVLSGLQTALAGQVHNVLGAARDQQGYERLSGLVLAVQLAFGTLVVVLALTAGWVIKGLLPGSELAAIMTGIGIMAGPFLLRDGIRRMLYTRRRLGVIIPMGVVSSAAMILGAVGIHEHWIDPTAGMSIAIMAVSAAVACLPGLAGLIWDGLSFHSVSWREDARESWNLARFMVGGEMIRVVNSSLANWIITIVAGLPALGAYRAAVHFTNALNPVQQAVGSYLPSVAAMAWKKHDPVQYRTRVGLLGLQLTAGFGALALMLALAGPELLEMAYEDRYTAYPMALMLSLTVLARVFDFGRLVAQIGLIAARRSQVVLVTAITQSALLLTVGQALISRLQILGAAIWEPVIRSVQAAISWRLFLSIGQPAAPAAAPDLNLEPGTVIASGSEADILAGPGPSSVIKRFRGHAKGAPRVVAEASQLTRVQEDREAIPHGVRYPRVRAFCDHAMEIEMERVPGITLKHAIETGCLESGVGYKVAEGLVHYTETLDQTFHDFSPSNVLWDADRKEAWLIDLAAAPLLGEPNRTDERCARSLGYYLGILGYEMARPGLPRLQQLADHVRLFGEMVRGVERAGYSVSQRHLIRAGWRQYTLSGFQGGWTRQTWYRSLGSVMALTGMAVMLMSARQSD